MKFRALRLREVVVGLSFLAAALLLVWSGMDGTVELVGFVVGPPTVAVGFLMAGFGVAAALSLWDGDEHEGIGDLVAVLGWLCLLLAAVTVFDFFAVIGVVLVLGAGAYLVANGLGMGGGQAGSRAS